MLLFQTGPFQPGPLEQEDQVWNPAVVVAPVSLEKVGLKLSWCGTGLGDFGCDQHEIIRHEVHMRAVRDCWNTFAVNNQYTPFLGLKWLYSSQLHTYLADSPTLRFWQRLPSRAFFQLRLCDQQWASHEWVHRHLLFVASRAHLIGRKCVTSTACTARLLVDLEPSTASTPPTHPSTWRPGKRGEHARI